MPTKSDLTNLLSPDKKNSVCSSRVFFQCSTYICKKTLGKLKNKIKKKRRKKRGRIVVFVETIKKKKQVYKMVSTGLYQKKELIREGRSKEILVACE